MNTLTSFITDPIASALGWTLMHSLWQAALTALALALVRPLLKNHSSQTRYLISLASMGFLLLLSAATFIKYYSSPVELSSIYQGEANAGLIFPATETIKASSFSLSAFIERNAFLIVNCWMVGVFLFSLRLLGGWLYLQRILRVQINSLAPEWKDKVHELQSRIGLDRYIDIAESRLVKSPVVIGHLKPLILLPIGAVNGLSVQQVEAIIAHEIAHIRRNDFLVNIFQSISEILFFFNPAFWWISGTVRKERENCCDDLAIGICNNSLILAQALTTLEEIRLKGPQLALNFTGNHGLLNRIIRLISPAKLKPSFYESLTATGILVISILVISICLATNSKVLSQNISAAEKKDTSEIHVSPPKAAEPAVKSRPVKKKAPAASSVSDTLDNKEIQVQKEEQSSAPSPSAREEDPALPAPPFPPVPGSHNDKAYTEAMMRFKAKMKAFEKKAEKSGKLDMKLFDEAMAEFDKGMQEFNRGMEEFDRGMKEFDKSMRGNGHMKFKIPPVPPMPPMPHTRAEVAPEELSRKIHAEVLRKHKEAIKKLEEGMKRYEEGWKKAGAEQSYLERSRRESAERERNGSKDFEKQLERELKRDGLISDSNHYNFKLDESSLSVNGKKQSKSLHEKYSKMAREFIGSDVKKVKKSKEQDGDSTISITK